MLNFGFVTQTGTSLLGTAPFDVFCVKIELAMWVGLTDCQIVGIRIQFFHVLGMCDVNDVGICCLCIK